MAYKEITLDKAPTEKEFFDFVSERQSVWVRKELEKSPWPWSHDPILNKYFFCNVFRKNDKGTQWAIKNIIEPNDYGGGLRTMLYHTVAYRCCNLPATFEEVGLPDLFEEVEYYVSKMQELQDMKVKVFNSAYRASSFGPTPRLEIYRKILDEVNYNIGYYTKEVFQAKCVEDAWKTVKSIWGIGGFIANEILLDLRYSSWGEKYKDDPFVNVGPGAAYGLRMMYGNLSESAQKKKLFELRDKQREYLSKRLMGESLTVADIQFSMCEFRKYISLKNGAGKIRKYKGE